MLASFFEIACLKGALQLYRVITTRTDWRWEMLPWELPCLTVLWCALLFFFFCLPDLFFLLTIFKGVETV